MSSVVSHQILQQLGVIGLYADLIRNADGACGGRRPQMRSNAAAIEGALADVNRVLTDLLVFSKDLRLNLYTHALAAAARGVRRRLPAGGQRTAGHHPRSAARRSSLRSTSSR